jgi:hypothetical protein
MIGSALNTNANSTVLVDGNTNRPRGLWLLQWHLVCVNAPFGTSTIHVSIQWRNAVTAITFNSADIILAAADGTSYQSGAITLRHNANAANQITVNGTYTLNNGDFYDLYASAELLRLL